jgi:ABC-type nitrate/sulfonate/bicarbonate transport system substrate-binding protein
MTGKLGRTVSLILAPLSVVLLGLALSCGSSDNSATTKSSGTADVAQSQVRDQAASPTPSPGAAASSQAAGPGDTETKTTVLRVPTSHDPTSPNVFLVSQATGIAKKYHLDFEYVGVIPAPQLVAAVVGNRIDTNQPTHINRTIAGISAGAKILSVVGNTETSQRVPHMIGIVPKNSSIKTADDLVGKRIGITTIGGCHEYTPYAWLGKNGIENPKTKVNINVIPLSAIEQTLRQGDIDLAMLHKVPEEIIRQGEFDVVFSDYDVWGPDGGGTPHFFTHEFIKNNPEVVRNFVAAMSETVNWCNEHPHEAREITAKGSNYDVNKIAERYYVPNGIITPQSITVWIDLLVEYGEIKPGITLEQVYTNEFNPHYEQGT